MKCNEYSMISCFCHLTQVILNWLRQSLLKSANWNQFCCIFWVGTNKKKHPLHETDGGIKTPLKESSDFEDYIIKDSSNSDSLTAPKNC